MKKHTHLSYQNTDHLITFSTLLETPVSIFESVRSINPSTTELGNWISLCTNSHRTDNKYFRQLAEQFRQTGNSEIKKSLPAICPGALMTTRSKDIPNEKKISNITGFMQFDIDLKDNPHILNATELRDEIRNFVYVVYCSLSVSGKGVWGLVQVKFKERYKEHFLQLKLDFEHMGIHLDPSKGGNPTDLRIFSFDPDAYVATSFKIYDRLYYSKKNDKRLLEYNEKSSTYEKVKILIQKIQNMNIDIAPDYNTYLYLGFAFASYFKEEGRHLFHAACSCSPKYDANAADKQFSQCLKGGQSGVGIGTFFYICKNAGLY